VFRSAVSDVSARFFAKDMHSSKRAQIEKEVQERMNEILLERGFMIESVLMKSVRLPEGLTQSIEEKLQAEQESQRMEFVLSREKMEADRLKIEAEGIRDYQRIISEGLNPMILQFMSIEAFRELSKSSNSKVIITDGKTPLMLNNAQ
jgi:regulator of protease activity HflC (stomatin/prohibitin superfamily)